MVKTRTVLAAFLSVAAVGLLLGCSARGPLVALKPEMLQLSAGPTGTAVSLAADAASLHAVFPDRATAGLDIVTVPIGPHLPPSAPPIQLIDKVDIAAPLSPHFGEHVLAVGAGRVAVLYLDRETDTHDVLKLASRSPADTQWNLEVLEPPGDPLALFPSQGDFVAAWAKGLLSYRSADGEVLDAMPVTPFQLQGRPASDGADGFSAFSRTASALLALRWTGSGFSVQKVPDGGEVNASLRSPSGKLSIVSYNPGSRRLLLHQQAAGSSSFSTQTVTVCDGTSGVALLPGTSDSSFLFVFDETRTLAAGRTSYQLSVIAPGHLLGTPGGRYRKAVLTEGDLHIDGFAAARTADALYVLVSQGTLKILRVPLGA